MLGRRLRVMVVATLPLGATWAVHGQQGSQVEIGREIAVARHLQDDEEFRVSLAELLDHGKLLFTANWTEQEGAGRPLTKGTGKDLTDPSRPLTGNRAFNRISGPDANSCAGCHNAPYGIAGGGGDIVTNVFVQAQRFDFATLELGDDLPTRGTVDEVRERASIQTVGNSRATTGMFGAGYLEMLARQMTSDLHTIRDLVKPGEAKGLVSKGISFGEIARRADGSWDTSRVTGLIRQSLLAPTPVDRPSLVIRPWHQSSNAVSLREFSNTAFNHHHGIQSTERFGRDTDPDGDGFTNELTRADVTAVAVWQATMAVPGRVIPNNPVVERAVLRGEAVFSEIGCASCHIPALPLDHRGWIYSEPNPYNLPTNLRVGETRTLEVDLTDARLPQPRLVPAPASPGVVMVPAYTDLKLHDITDPSDPAEAEPIDMNWTVWSPKYNQGNRRFLTKRLWGAANEPPFFHHGLFTTLRQAVLAHAGEALAERRAFQQAARDDQDSLIEFLKSLQVLPPGTPALIVDEHFHEKQWPPKAVAEVGHNGSRSN
jgi:hypothetical protein